jgi:hypothetical protein
MLHISEPWRCCRVNSESDVERDLGHLCIGATSSLDVNGYYIKELLFVTLLLPFQSLNIRPTYIYTSIKNVARLQ